MSRRFLLQMAGTSGAGKSTLAAAIGRATGAVVIDKDILKGGMLDGGVSEEVAAPTAYAVFFDLGASLLAQGFSVVLDSPAYYDHIRDRGREIADAHGACYSLIRCLLDDLGEVQRRMDARSNRASQPTRAAPETFARPGTSPLAEPHAVIDMRQPLEVSLAQALEYLGIRVPAGVDGRGQG